MALREILATFGIDVDDRQLQSGVKSVNSFESTLRNVAQTLVAGALVNGFKSMIESSIELGSQINDTADRLGVGTTELQEFQFAGKLAGISADEMSQSLGFLNKTLGEAAGGGSAQAQAFQKLGINIKDSNGKVRDAATILPELADKIQGMGSQAEKTAAVVGVLGRSGANLLPLLKDGSKGILEAQQRFKDLGLEIDKNFIANADAAGDEIDTLKTQFDVLKTKLVGESLPAIKNLGEVILKVGVFIGDLLKNTNAAIIVFAAFAAGALVAAYIGFTNLAVAIGVSLSELLLIIAIFVAVALVVEDIYTLFTGGDSVIGRFIDKLFGVGASKKFVEEVKTTVGELWDKFQQLLPSLEELGGKLMEVFRAVLPYVAQFEKANLQGFVISLKYVASEISAMISTLQFLFSFWSKGYDVWKAGIDDIRAAFASIIDTINEVIAAAGRIPGVGAITGALGLGAKATTGSVAGGVGGDKNVSQQNQTTINVSGADQPQSVAAQVANSLTNTFESQTQKAWNAVTSLF